MKFILGTKEQPNEAAAEEGAISRNWGGWINSVLSSQCKTTFVQRVQSAIKPNCILLREKQREKNCS